MPRSSIHLAVGALVSVKPHFLRSAPVYQALRSLTPLDAPGTKLIGVIQSPTTLNDRPAWMEALNVLPDSPFALLPTSLRYEGPRPARSTRVDHPATPPAATAVRQEVEGEGGVDADLLEDAIASADEMEPEEEDAERINLLWREGRVDVDTRVSRPAESFHGRTIFHLPLKEYASPAQYFIRFLPERHIKEVVIPAINEHALTTMPSFKRVSFEEYIIWIALFVVMTTARMEDRAAYWHRGDFPYKLSINFSDYMDMSRFELLTKMHVFARPDGEL